MARAMVWHDSVYFLMGIFVCLYGMAMNTAMHSIYNSRRGKNRFVKLAWHPLSFYGAWKVWIQQGGCVGSSNYEAGYKYESVCSSEWNLNQWMTCPTSARQWKDSLSLTCLSTQVLESRGTSAELRALTFLQLYAVKVSGTSEHAFKVGQ
jgi:hypothetical protein